MVNQQSLNELALFAGAGGGILGGKLLGWRTVCAVEWEAYPASVLCARQNDGLLETFPIWDDIQTFDGKPWRGIVDVVSGGFPCQDISAAGKGAGIDGERSGMWAHMARVVSEIRPQYVFVENSPMLVTRGLERVLADFASLGYDCKWAVMGAADVGAPHQRDRIWVVGKMANTNGNHDAQRRGNSSISKVGGQRGTVQRGGRNDVGSITNPETDETLGSKVAFTESARLERWNDRRNNEQAKPRFGQGSWPIQESWFVEPNVGRVANGVAARVDRLKAIGNGQVPLCAATAWRMLSE